MSIPSYFPREIEREIFELAGRTYPEIRTTLLRVATRVKEWLVVSSAKLHILTVIWTHLPLSRVEPLLYETVVLCDLVNEDLVQLITNGPSRYSRHVKDLWVKWTIDAATVKRFLILCQNVVKLEFTIAFDHEFWPLLGNLCPEIVSIHAHALCSSPLEADLTSNFFHRITHLRLVGFEPMEGEWRLDTLPSLTHLALDYMADPIVDACFRNALSSPRFKILVGIVDDGDDSLEFATAHLESHPMRDSRLILLEPLSREVSELGILEFWNVVDSLSRRGVEQTRGLTSFRTSFLLCDETSIQMVFERSLQFHDGCDPRKKWQQQLE